jgi:hypothetical protein
VVAGSAGALVADGVVCAGAEAVLQFTEATGAGPLVAVSACFPSASEPITTTRNNRPTAPRQPIPAIFPALGFPPGPRGGADGGLAHPGRKGSRLLMIAFAAHPIRGDQPGKHF